MADGKLVFPVKFDLQRAVADAQGDIDKVLRQMQTAVNSRPLKIHTDISELKAFEDRLKNLNIGKEWSGSGKNMFLAAEGSIASINAQMDKLIQEWQKLAESERVVNRETGEYTDRAKQIIQRYAELTGASRTYAKSLDTLQREADKAVRAQEKDSQAQAKRIAKSQEMVRMLNAEELSLSAVAQKMKFYQDQASKHNLGTKEYQYATQQLERLGAQYERLKLAMNDASGNKGKDIIGAENIKRTLRGAEDSIEQVKAKLKALDQVLATTKQGSFGWNRAADEAARLNGVLDEMKAKQKEATKTEAELKAEREAAAQALKKVYDEANREYQKMLAQQRANYASKKEAGLALQNTLFGNPKTLDEYNAKISALQAKLNTLDPNSARFLKFNAELEKTKKELADVTNAIQQMSMTVGSLNDLNARLSQHMARLNELSGRSSAWEQEALAIRNVQTEINRLNERLALYQHKAFQGLSDSMTQYQVDKLKPINAEIERLINKYNILNAKGLAFDTNGNLTPAAASTLAQLNAEYEKQGKILRDVDSAMDAYKKKLADEEAEVQRLAKLEEERNKRLQEHRAVLNGNEKRIESLTAKLQMYQSVMQKQEVGSTAWNKNAAEVARLTEELRKANEQMQAYQEKAFRGLNLSNLNTQAQELIRVREQIEAVDKVINHINMRKTQGTSTAGDDATLARKIQERIALTQKENSLRKTGADYQLEAEKKINDELAKRQTRQQKIHQQRVQSRLQSLKETHILGLDNSTIDNMNKKLALLQQKLQGADLKGTEFPRIAAEIKAITQELEKAQKEVDKLTGKVQKNSGGMRTKVNGVTQEFKTQTTYIERLIRRMAVYASVGAIGGFLTKVREVTAQFELQKVSLGAIIQDQTRANQLFSEIKTFALKSPVSIMDLTKYTKQLAAYKIGVDDLFETTKKLTDVSVGLGVSMDRVVLAYGQVRATGHLRASEIRQFTEMGVPIVEELAAKLSQMNGELVTSAQVMDMVSKRAISFDMVKQVFDDMTSAGGIFYNMQEKQGNTLYGMWMKLGDAASVMYDEIGNTGPVNSIMKGLINLITDLMRNWRLMAGEVMVGAAAWSAYAVQARIATAVSTAAATAQKKVVAAGKILNAILDEEKTKRGACTAAEWMSIQARKANAKAALSAALAEKQAATATGLWSQALGKLKAALVAHPYLAIATAIVVIGVAIAAVIEKSSRLRRELNSIEAETVRLQSQSVGRFEYLANAAVKAANGSKEQRDALEELSRTYGHILPQDALKLENLRRLDGSYQSLTKSLRDYIAEQQRQKALDKINETYQQQINDNAKKATSLLEKEKTIGLSRENLKIQHDVAIQIVSEMQRAMNEEIEKGVKRNISTAKRLQEAAKKYGIEMSDAMANAYVSSGGGDIGRKSRPFQEMLNAIAQEGNEVRDLSIRYEALNNDLGVFKEKIDAAKKSIEEIKYVQKDKQGNETVVDANSFLGQQTKANATMKKAAELIRNDEELKKAIQDKAIELQPEWIHIVDSVDPKDLMNITTVNFDAIINAVGAKYPELKNRLIAIQKEWGNVAPTDATVVQIRNKWMQLANGIKDGTTKMTKYLWDGSGQVDEYLKKLKGQQEELQQRIHEKKNQLKQMGTLSKWWNKLWGKDLEADIAQMEKELEAVDSLVTFTQGYVKEKETKSKGGSKQDSRLQNLKEEISLVQKLYQEYKQLEKQEGASKAASDMNRMAKDSIAMLSKKYGISLPKTAKDVVTALEILYGKMAQLPKKVFPALDKDLKELRWTIEKVDIDDSQANIEKSLKELADRISRTKTAKEFYEKILSQTGDVELAANVSLAIYGDTGKELFKNTIEQIREVFKSGNADVDLQIGSEIDSVIDLKNERINYGELAKIYEKYQNQIIEKNRDTASKIVSEGQKTAASNITTWQKELEKAKDFEQQRTDIINRETQYRAEIIKSNLPQEEKDRLTQASQNKQNKEIANINFKEFKESDDYVKIFENLDNVSTAALKRLKENIQEVINANKDLSPENMKTLVKAMEQIDEQVSGRGFGNDMVQSVKDYIQAIKDLKTAKAELKAADAEYNAQLPQLDADIQTAKDEEIAAQTALNALKAQEMQDANAIVSAELRLNQATANVAKAEEKKAEAANKVKKAEAKVTGEQDKQKKATGKFFNDLGKVAQSADQLANILGDVKDLLGVSADSAAGVAFDSAIQGLNEFSKIMNTIIALQTLYNIVTSSNPWLAIAAAVLAVGQMLGSFIANNKVRKANKEIEKQQKILDQLEYTYSRLEKAAEKAFGGDYINNFKQQQKNLQAQAVAYQKQLEAEKSKGKKADKEKIKEYEEKIRDVKDEIADLYGTISEKMLGTDLTSAARDFAQAWLDAYKEFGKTSDKMSEKFHEMIQNMVVEGALAKVMERALQPMFDMIDNMDEQDFYNETFWRNVVSTAEQGAKDADYGAQTMMKFLEKSGISMRDLGGDLTGISRDIASASEESINGLAAAENTRNFYIAQMLVEVQGIHGLLQGGTPTTDNTEAVQWKDWQGESMENIRAIERHTAETVAECKRAADRCEQIANDLHRTIDYGSGNARLRVKV